MLFMFYIGSTLSRMKEGVMKECNRSRFVRYFHIHTLYTQDIHISEIKFGFMDLINISFKFFILPSKLS